MIATNACEATSWETTRRQQQKWCREAGGESRHDAHKCLGTIARLGSYSSGRRGGRSRDTRPIVETDTLLPTGPEAHACRGATDRPHLSMSPGCILGFAVSLMGTLRPRWQPPSSLKPFWPVCRRHNSHYSRPIRPTCRHSPLQQRLRSTTNLKTHADPRRKAETG